MTNQTSKPGVLGGVLRGFRSEQGLTQHELARRAGVDRNYVGQIERGERNPSFGSLSRVLEGLGVGWDEFGARFEAARGKLESVEERLAGEEDVGNTGPGRAE